MKISLADCLSQGSGPDADGAGHPHLPTALSHGSMTLSALAASAVEAERRNDQDTLYIVTGGHGALRIDGEAEKAQAGEALFVPAGEAHRFSGLSEDFSGWIVSWGPSGGEAEAIEPSVFAAIDA